MSDMHYAVRGVRQLTRGFEAEVTVGDPGPNAAVTMKVTIGHIDEEWRVLRAKIDDLFARKAIEQIEKCVEFTAKKRADRVVEQVAA